MTFSDGNGEGVGGAIARGEFSIGDGRLTFEQFASINGGCAQGFGDAGMHRRGERHSDRTWGRVLETQRVRDKALYQRRVELRAAYAEMVGSGQIEPPTQRERILAIAAGNPDLESTRAARRLAERFYHGAGLGGDTPNAAEPSA